MITDRDSAVRAVAEQKPPTTKVREVTSQEVRYWGCPFAAPGSKRKNAKPV